MKTALVGYLTIQPLDQDRFLNYETLRFDPIFDVTRHAFITNFEAQIVAKEIAARDNSTVRVVLRHKNHAPYGEYQVTKDGVNRQISEPAS